jgi:hypothetical protein
MQYISKTTDEWKLRNPKGLQMTYNCISTILVADDQALSAETEDCLNTQYYNYMAWNTNY